MDYGYPTFEDVRAIARLFAEDMTHLGVDVSQEKMEELASDIVDDLSADDPTCLCWVARETSDDEPCGIVLANFNWSLKFGGRALWIEELYVNPQYRRMGVGRALVDLVLDYAEEHGIGGIDLEAYHGNTPASVLYRTMGFHRLGRERFYYRLGEDEYL